MPITSAPSTVSTTRQHALDLAQNLAATGRIEPAEVTTIAEQFRAFLDPRPDTQPSTPAPASGPLLARVGNAVNGAYREGYNRGLTPNECTQLIAQAVVREVADWLAAQPLAVYSAPPQFQRDHDVRLIWPGGTS